MDALSSTITSNSQSLAASITTTNNTVTSNSSSLASSITTLSSAVSSNSSSLAASITTTATTVAAVSGSVASAYTLAVTAGNRVTGFKILNNSVSSSFVIVADQFSVVNSAGGSAILPFTISGGVVYIDGAKVNSLSANIITAGTISSIAMNNGSGTWSVDAAGNITATAGTIGGAHISSTSVYGGTMSSLSSGTGWFLGNGGTAGFGSIGSNCIVWDGTKLKVTGGIYIQDPIGIRMKDDSSVLTITGGTNNWATSSAAQLDLSGATSSVGALAQLIAPKGFYVRTTGTNLPMFVSSSGVGFGGNSAPAHPIDCTGDGYFSGTVQASAFNSTSSRRFKTNIVTLTNSTDIIASLRGVRFDWKTRDIKNDVGMIAEEVNEVLPTLVNKDKDGQIESLEYSKVVAVLVEAVKEMSTEIKTLKAKVRALEEK